MFTTRRGFINKAGIAGISLVGSSIFFPLLQGCNLGGVKKPLNIVFILADDQGWNQVGYHGFGDFYETPNIDRIAREGMHFTDAYSASPICSPTRASLMTGKNPARLHLTDYIPGGLFPYAPLQGQAIQTYLPLEEKILPQYLAEKGYVCGHFGKWHLSPDRHFDEPGRFYDPQYRGFYDVLLNAKPEEDHNPYDDAHHVESITQRSLKFLEENKDKPFFLYMSHHVVHRPLIETPELIEKYASKPDSDNPVNNPIMGAMVERMDNGIGRVLDKLDELGLTGNTVVIYYSDNGGLKLLQSQDPLRGGKAMVFEGGIRVPFCVRWPGVIEPGSKSSIPVISDDFFPTILEIVGIKPGMEGRDGKSMVSILKGDNSLERDALYWHYPHYHHLGFKPSGAIRVGDYKLIEWFEESIWGLPNQISLYNISDDISESKDLSYEMPELAAKMREQLHRWRRSVNAQEMTRNPFYDPDRIDVRLGAM
jgi:arylsulfatase A